MPDALPVRLQADCSACEALCCVGPAFDADQGFGYDKPAHQPCRHLCASNACAIHAGREALGFRACGLFDCQGAGQRVTAMFAPSGWRDDPAVATRVFDAFARMRGLHELLVLLAAAGTRARGDAARHAIAALVERVESACGGPPSDFLARDAEALRREVLGALRHWRASLA